MSHSHARRDFMRGVGALAASAGLPLAGCSLGSPAGQAGLYGFA